MLLLMNDGVVYTVISKSSFILSG